MMMIMLRVSSLHPCVKNDFNSHKQFENLFRHDKFAKIKKKTQRIKNFFKNIKFKLLCTKSKNFTDITSKTIKKKFYVF